ncbi:hypothetical protein BZA05DRAFT_98000 [Tricharina praecox]|uniref:uncharacterized protein n=1 Tax=Tricharina praecox TaxID=43433 RepID=UPI00221FF683|nr:uncharacterized protein BZA05DRAFT_98000 [Tricharina praecox]KAI5857505.1 hypothetical protein BZA05DRAFT_98000 [Tricharina praecox]
MRPCVCDSPHGGMHSRFRPTDNILATGRVTGEGEGKGREGKRRERKYLRWRYSTPIVFATQLHNSLHLNSLRNDAGKAAQQDRPSHLTNGRKFQVYCCWPEQGYLPRRGKEFDVAPPIIPQGLLYVAVSSRLSMKCARQHRASANRRPIRIQQKNGKGIVGRSCGKQGEEDDERPNSTKSIRPGTGGQLYPTCSSVSLAPANWWGEGRGLQTSTRHRRSSKPPPSPLRSTVQPARKTSKAMYLFCSASTKDEWWWSFQCFPTQLDVDGHYHANMGRQSRFQPVYSVVSD